MKRKYFTIIIALFILLFVGLAIHYLLSLHKVVFDFQNNTKAITLYSKKDKKLKQFSSDSQTFLQDGDYYVIPEGDNLSTNKIPFSVAGKDVNLAINPSYTDKFLSELLTKELPLVTAALSEKYPSLIDGYTLSQGKLYAQGQWFGGLLKPKVSDIREQKDPYRVILHKVDSKWEVIRRPEYILAASRYQEVPIAILRDINAIVGEPGN